MANTQEADLLNVYSDEITDIMSSPPHRILSIGNIIIAVAVLLFVTVAGVIKYPDIIVASVRITSNNPPARLIAQTKGKITDLFFQNGDSVTQNEIVAVIENSANTQDILSLKKITDLIDTCIDMPHTLNKLIFPTHLQVGEMQQDYLSLYEAVNNYYFFITNHYYVNKLKDITRQEQTSVQIEQAIKEREKILKDQLKIEVWKDSAYKELLKNKVISIKEYNDIRKAYLGQYLNDADNLNVLLQNRQQYKELQKSESDIKQQYRINEKDVILAIQTSAKKIKGQIANWEKLYVLKTPVSGKISFFRVWKVNQFVSPGNLVFIVVPAGQEFEVRAQVPLFKSGKIRPGQKALLKLEEYPYEEFGILKGSIKSMTNVAFDSLYSIELELENGLMTTRNKSIDFKPEMNGIAEIITNNKNMFQRLFEKIYGKVNEK